MKEYNEQVVETLDDAGCIIANKNIIIDNLQARIAELEEENASLKRDAIPDGCVLVPKEYCREIGDAASEYFESFGQDFKVRTPGTFLFSKLWEAMLAAAPKQEK